MLKAVLPALVLFSTIVCSSAQQAKAQSEESSSIGVTLCAAIVACDEDGIVASPYREGPCAEEIQKRCDIVSSVKAHNAELEKTNKILADKIAQLEKSLRRTQKQLAKKRR